MLPPEVVQQIRHIQIRTNRMADELLQGSYHSAFKGHGMEFEQVREYEPGDDIRSIDWNVTARMDAPFIKQFVEEREVTVMLLVDISASGLFGSENRLKKEIIAEFAAVIAYSAIKNSDKVGLILFSEKVEKYIPPRKGRNHIWKVIQEILTHQPQHTGTNLQTGLDTLLKVVHRKSIAFLISDFMASGYETTLKLCQQRHDMIAVPIVDPREKKLPPVGILHLRDPETGRLISVDTYNQYVVEQYQQQREAHEEALRELLKKSNVDVVWVYTNQPYLIPLIRLFQRRGKRR